MSNPVHLSIITPAFKGAHYLESCLKNVADQWVPGIEHVVVDGGSTDGTVEILQTFSAKYGHISWVSEKDNGQSNAMNKGIAMAKGKWISFLNVDDFYEPDILPRIVQFSKDPHNQGKILVGNLNILQPNGTLKQVNKPAHMRLSLLLADICEWPYNPSAYFYPKAIHAQIGNFPENEHYAMDYDFILKAATHGIAFKYFNETWGNFRLLPEAKTSTDQAANTSYERSAQLRKHYKTKLTPIQKIEVDLLIFYWRVRNFILSRLK